MTPVSDKTVLITGANGGLGKEVARQLALQGNFAKIYLGCRNPQRAQAAQRDLERTTGMSIFAIALMDVSDPRSVTAAISSIEGPLDALVMNAGGSGGPTPMALTADGVTQLFASNVLGHVALLESLLAGGRISGVTELVGSEAAVGVPKLRIPRPTFASSSADEFASVIDGSFFAGGKVNAGLAYGQVKYLGALWMAALARKHPELRFITMSPGNTAGTDVNRDLPAPAVLLVRHVLPRVAPILKIGHELDVGARRLTDGLTDPSLANGAFYASAANQLTGPIVDQATISPDLRDPAIQDQANEAIHRFL